MSRDRFMVRSTCPDASSKNLEKKPNNTEQDIAELFGKNDVPCGELDENLRKQREYILDEIINSENPGDTALEMLDNKEYVYYVIWNIKNYESKIDPEMEKRIIIKAIEYQPGSVLSHRKEYKLLSDEDKKEIAQTFIDYGYADILVHYLREEDTIDKGSMEIFNNVINENKIDIDAMPRFPRLK